MDDEALMHTAAHGAFFVVQRDLEHQLPAFHGGQLALTGHGHAHGGGGGVLQLQLGAHRAAALIQSVGDAHPAGLFGQRHQCGGGEDIQRAAAHGLGGVLGGDGDALLAADSGF